MRVAYAESEDFKGRCIGVQKPLTATYLLYETRPFHIGCVCDIAKIARLAESNEEFLHCHRDPQQVKLLQLRLAMQRHEDPGRRLCVQAVDGPEG